MIVPFAVLISQGWSKRRDVQSHKRYMLSAAIISMMGLLIGRLPMGPPILIVVTI